MINKCEAHSEFDFRLNSLDDGVGELKHKWDKLQCWITGIAVAVILDLVGIIIILITK